MLQRSSTDVWRLVRRQHGVVAREQLIAPGFGEGAIEHRLRRGRLHRLWKGVYAVGRPEVGRDGLLMAAALSCGPHASISHRSAGWLWGMVGWCGSLDVVVPSGVLRRRQGIRVHRRLGFDPDRRFRIKGIPVTDPADTLIDLACELPDPLLERAIREADRLGLIDPETLRAALDDTLRRPGIGRLRSLLDMATFALTDSELERRFLRLVRAAKLPAPRTQAWLNGYRVDFYWPALGLVVETDGLTYHRTASQQATDRLRDQAQAAAGLTVLRFTAFQVRFEPERTTAVLTTVASRLDEALPGHPPG
jgi:very-short-patch-repair endonuclease